MKYHNLCDMIKTTIKPLLALSLLAMANLSQAQIDAGQVIRAGKDDGSTLMDAYASPLLNTIGAGLNSGWYQTAKPLGKLGFNFNFSLNAVTVPTSDKSFDVSQLNLKTVSLVKDPNNSAISPTVFGKEKAGSEMEVRANINGIDSSLYRFNLPKGGDFGFMFVPTAQLQVGIGFHTEVGVRFVPSIDNRDIGFSLWGFSIKHDVKHYIPGVKALPFDMSVMFGYTALNSELKFDGSNSIQADADANTYNPNSGKTYSGQRLELTGGAWTTNLLISKKLGPLTGYIGLGYQYSNMELAMKGEYPVTLLNANFATFGHPSFGKTKVVEEVKDPFKVNSSFGGFRGNVGLRLKLTVLTIHADYTLGQYNVISAGLGISMQSLVPPSL